MKLTTPTDPLHFRIRLPGRDIIDSRGILSVTYQMEGQLHFDGEMVMLEWAAIERAQSVSFAGIKDEVDQSPIGSLELSAKDLSEVRLRGGWWAPRLDIRARRLNVFEGIPNSRPGTVSLRIHRRDRRHAKLIFAAIDGVLSSGKSDLDL